MHPAREMMQLAIKSIVIPELRALRFKGSMPHFRRLVDERADLLTFQFNLSGGSFVVELAICTPEHIAKHWRADLELKNVTAHDMNNRRRLGSSMQGGDHWFVYGKKNYEPNHEQVLPAAEYEQVARDVVTQIQSQAESWWTAEHA
jgi:Domain of unknown function (DUF4304)